MAGTWWVTLDKSPWLIADFYSALLGQDQLEYVTAFQGGVLSFNANGPAFLNTLNELENGYGYWVKADLGTGMGLLTDRAVSPAHDFVNGPHPQPARRRDGDRAHRWSGRGRHRSARRRLSDDHATLRRCRRIRRSSSRRTHRVHLERKDCGRGYVDGQRILHKVDLDFAVDAVATFPNPATEWTELRFDGVEPMQVLVRDAAGSRSGPHQCGQPDWSDPPRRPLLDARPVLGPSPRQGGIPPHEPADDRTLTPQRVPTMKHLITCCMLTLSLAGWGQLQFASNSAEVYFPPTTVDSLRALFRWSSSTS